MTDEIRWAEAAAPIVVRLEQLLDGQDRRTLEETLTAARALPPAPAGLGEARTLLYLRLQDVLVKAAVRLDELREADERRRRANLPRLEELVARAEARAACPEAELAQAVHEMKVLQIEWRALGGAPRDRADDLASRFGSAADRLHERAHAEFTQRDQERLANLAKKEDLCARAEALVSAEAWNTATEMMKVLQEEWKSIGAVPRLQSDAVWLRFRRAADQLFARREVVAGHGEGDAAAADIRALLVALCQRAEAVQDSPEWKATADLLKALQAEWRQVRSAGGGGAEADALWQRFRAACDHFFDRRQAALIAQDQQRQANLVAKEALVGRARALADDPELADPQEAVRTLMRAWRTIGSVPRGQSDEQWSRFCGACEAIQTSWKEPATALTRPAETTPPVE